MIINGFINATRDTLNRIKSDFVLVSDVEAFIPMQNHFRSVEMREPTSEELRLYDALVQSRTGEPADAVITSLAVENDLELAKTFEDFKNKFPTKNKFYSLTELFSAVDSLLNTIAPISTAEFRTFGGDNALISSALFGSEHTLLIKTDRQLCAVGIGQKPTALPPVCDGDCYILVTKGTALDFVSSLSSLIGDEKENLQIKYANLIGNGGLLRLILDSAPGGLVDIADLHEYASEPSVSVLTQKIPDSALVILPEYLMPIFAATCGNYGLSSVMIGRTSSVKRLAVTYQGRYPTSFATDFLRSVIHRIKHSAIIGAQPSPDVKEQGFSVNSDTSDYAIDSNGLSVTAISAAPAFGNALFAVLEAVCRLVSRGVPYEQITLSLCAEMNLNEGRGIGDILAMLLGAYRAQAELALGSCGSLCQSSELDGLTVFAVGKPSTQTTKNEFAKADSRVYLLAPRQTDGNLPDFRDERLLLGYVNQIISEDKVLSVRAVGTKKAEHTVKLMCGDNLAFESVCSPEYSDSGSFIVESDAEIDGLLLGYTREIK